MATGITRGKYGYLTWGDVVSLAVTLFKLPIVIGWNVTKSVLIRRPSKGITKATALAAVKYLNKRASVAQLQYVSGSTSSVYHAWAKRQNLPVTVEPLVDDATLYWIGPKRTERVVLYVHGGGFFAPAQDFAFTFWNYVRLQLEKNDCNAGFAVLGYSLLPTAVFPAQLRQLAVVVDHLLATGVHPGNTQLVGDSAGGNLILQLLSQLLHPIDKVGPVSSLKSPFRGVYLMSPWVNLESNSDSFKNSQTKDIFEGPNIEDWAKLYLEEVKASQRVYIDPFRAPAGWFGGLESVVERVLVSCGADERFKDDIVQFSAGISSDRPKVQLEIQEEGVHNDPYFDFLVTDSPSQLGSLTPMIIKWLKQGFVV